MTDYTRVRNTIMSNPRGIMDSILSHGLQHRIKSNVRIYFYKYNPNDLIEIEYRDNIICVYDFAHTQDKSIKVFDDLEFYAGYFKTAGLENKRFLFDVSMKMPVNYDDFIEMPWIPFPGNKIFAFMLDKKTGYVYGENVVSIYVSTERVPAIDKCILAFMNESIKIKAPKVCRDSGNITSIILSGLLSGIPYEDIKYQIDLLDSTDKFTGTTSNINFNSEFIDKAASKLKTDKFTRIIKNNKPEVLQGEIVEKQTINGEVNLQDIVLVGLDKFMKVLDTTKDVIRVNIDCEHQTIRSAYIVKGCVFITPVTFMPISYFRELLDSDNIEYIIN